MRLTFISLWFVFAIREYDRERLADSTQGAQKIIENCNEVSLGRTHSRKQPREMHFVSSVQELELPQSWYDKSRVARGQFNSAHPHLGGPVHVGLFRSC